MRIALGVGFEENIIYQQAEDEHLMLFQFSFYTITKPSLNSLGGYRRVFDN